MKILKKLKIILPILICLVIPFLVVGCKDKDKEKTYAVTYSYGDAKSLFNNTVKGSDLNDENKLINIPSIKKEYEKAFDGWYVVDSLTKVDEDTPIDSGTKLEPKFF